MLYSSIIWLLSPRPSRSRFGGGPKSSASPPPSCRTIFYFLLFQWVCAAPTPQLSPHDTHTPTYISFFGCLSLTRGYQIIQIFASRLHLIEFTHRVNLMVQRGESPVQALFKIICIFKWVHGQGQRKSAWIHAYAHFDTSDFFCAYNSFWILAYAMFQ